VLREGASNGRAHTLRVVRAGDEDDFAFQLWIDHGTGIVANREMLDLSVRRNRYFSWKALRGAAEPLRYAPLTPVAPRSLVSTSVARSR